MSWVWDSPIHARRIRPGECVSLAGDSIVPNIENNVPRSKLAERIVRSAEIDQILKAVTDVELAEFLLDHVWIDMDMLTTEASLVSEAIDRLRRERAKPIRKAWFFWRRKKR